MVELELLGSNLSLKFAVFDAGDNMEWCEVFLVQNGMTQKLGGDSKKVVFKRLLPILNATTFPPTPTRLKDGNLYTCVMMLYEQKTSAYARKIDLGLELQFLNNLGEAIATSNLSLQECEIWQNKLTQFI